MRVVGSFVALGLMAAFAGCGGGPVTAPVVDGATVSPAPTLRQGQDGVSLVVLRAAGGLADAAAFDLGGLVVARQAESTDTRLVLAVSVPHGVALGARTLTFTDARGDVSFPNLVEVGAITSDPAGIDTNVGTSAAPFRTVKRAVEAAGPSDTIQLAGGSYDATSGETWGYTLPPMLTLVGQATASTTLSGPLVNGSVVAGTIAFIVPAGLVIKALTLTSFDTGLGVIGPGALTMTDVDVLDAQTAAVSADAAGVTLTLSGGALSAAQDAIFLRDHCTACALDVTRTSLTGGAFGGHTVEISEKVTGARAVLRQVDISGDLFVGGDDADVSVSTSSIKEVDTNARATINFNGRALDVTDSLITLHADNFGINFLGDTLALSGVTIEGGKYGVYQLSGSAKVRGTTIRDYGYMGYYLAQGDLDLGTATERGGNTLSSAATGPAVFGLYVDAIDHPVTSSNTTFNGVEPPAGTLTAGTEPIAVPGEYFINYGKTMSFWTL